MKETDSSDNKPDLAKSRKTLAREAIALLDAMEAKGFGNADQLIILKAATGFAETQQYANIMQLALKNLLGNQK